MNLESSPLSAPEYYHVLRSQIEHEDNLITQRLSWFLTSQSFLFSAFAIVLNSPTVSRFNGEIYKLVLHMVPMLGIAVGALIWLAIVAGVSAMARLRKLYVQRKELHEFPPIQGRRRTMYVGIAAPILLPPLFVIVWVILLRYS